MENNAATPPLNPPMPQNVSVNQSMNQQAPTSGTSNDTKTIITVLLLVFIYPAGLIVMWTWTKWPIWLKIVLSLPVVILILAIAAGIFLVGIDPEKQFAQANNTKRQSDVNEILNAVSQYESDHHGKVPANVNSTPLEIKSGNGGVDICAALIPTYIASLPVDPRINGGTSSITSCSSYDTGYTISVDANNKVTVSAPDAEMSQSISETR